MKLKKTYIITRNSFEYEIYRAQTIEIIWYIPQQMHYD